MGLSKTGINFIQVLDKMQPFFWKSRRFIIKIDESVQEFVCMNGSKSRHFDDGGFAVTNSDDHKFDDFQSSESEQEMEMARQDIDFLRQDMEQFGDFEKVSDPFELDLSDESQLGENSPPFANAMDMFDDLDSQHGSELLESEQISGVSLDENKVAEVAEESPFPFDDLDVVTDESVEPFDVLADLESELPEDRDATLEDYFNSAETDEATTAPLPHTAWDDPLPVMGEVTPVVEDKKAKKAREKAEQVAAKAKVKEEKAKAKEDKTKVKPSKKEKPPKGKKEKKPRVPGEKEPLDVSALCFMGSLLLLLLAFGGVNVYAVMNYGIGAMVMVFLAFFDILATIALVIPLVLRRSKVTVTASDVSLGIAAISLVIGCMFVLVNIAYNWPPPH